MTATQYSINHYQSAFVPVTILWQIPANRNGFHHFKLRKNSSTKIHAIAYRKVALRKENVTAKIRWI